MRKFFFLVGFLWAGLLFSGFTQAEDFSAQVVTVTPSETVRAKVYVKEDKVRMDSPGSEEYTVLRKDKSVIWIVIPAEKTYIEVPSKQAPGPKEKMRGEVSRRFLGTEAVNGYDTKKYEVSYKDKDTLLIAFQWVASELDHPIKLAAVDGSWSTEYRNIQVGEQPERIFEIPEGFEQISRPARQTPESTSPGKRD